MHGIAISTYVGPKSHPLRTSIVLASIHSLLASEYPGKIVVVDDGSITKDHITHFFDITDRIKFIRHDDNLGIARTKNDGLEAIVECEHKFLADDDLLYNGDWWSRYIQASTVSGIHHFSYYVPQLHHTTQADVVKYKGSTLVRHAVPNGCLLFVTDTAIKKVPMFAITPNKAYLEHPNFSQHCVVNKLCPFLCDVHGSRDHIRLNRSSYDCKSVSKL